MEIPEKLRCFFTADVQEKNGSYVVKIPLRELENGAVQPGDAYRIALLGARTASTSSTNATQSPPVSEGETREVEIEDIGEQGDGIARVERGYVIIVPKAGIGEHVTIRVSKVKENVAFATVVDR